MKSIVALLTVVLVSLASVAPARVEAQAAAPTAEQRARAREAYTRGQTLFDGGQFEQAQVAFEEAYAAVPNPIVLLGVASAQERRGLRAAARATLERYLRESPNARDRAQIEERIAALPAPTATTTGTTSSSGTGTTTGTSTTGMGTTGTSTTGTSTTGTSTTGTSTTGTSTTGTTGTTTSSGTATATATTGTTTSTAVTTSTTQTATEGEAEAEAEPAEEAEGEAEAEEAEAGAEEAGEGEEPAAPTGPSTTVWVLTAVGAVGLVTGTVFGFMALSRQSDFDAMPTLSAADEGEAFALVADISFGIALAGGIAAIVLYATEGSGTASSDSASLRLLPSVSPQGGGLVALGRF